MDGTYDMKTRYGTYEYQVCTIIQVSYHIAFLFCIINEVQPTL